MKYRIFRTGLENSLFHRIFYCYILPSMMITRRCQSLLLYYIYYGLAITASFIEWSLSNQENKVILIAHFYYNVEISYISFLDFGKLSVYLISIMG